MNLWRPPPGCGDTAHFKVEEAMTTNATRIRPRGCRVHGYETTGLAPSLTCAGLTTAAATGQRISATHGQGVVPVLDGSMENPDGTFDMILGYMNLNTEEIVDIPIGPDNRLEPSGP